MTTLKRVAIVGLAVIGAATVELRAEENHKAEIDRARAMFKLLVDGRYDDFVAACDETMKAALPAATLRKLWTDMTASYGAYEQELGVTVIPVDVYTAVVFRCGFHSAALDIRITLNKGRQVAGLHFSPSSQDIPYTPPEYVHREKFDEEEVTVSAGQFPLGGTVSTPRGAGPFPGVVLVHGSGPHDRDETIFKTRPFRDIAWGLASRGIAVLRYEKRTKTYAKRIDPVKMTVDQETVDDAVAAVRLLRRRPKIDPARVYVAGHSLGATAAPRIAARESSVAGIIMLAAAARPIHELVEEQVDYLAHLDGSVDEAERRQLDNVRKTVAALRNGTWEAGDALLGAPVEYWVDLAKLDPVRTAASLPVPILIVQGGRDYQVTERDYSIWRKALADKKNVSFRHFEKLDHLLHAGTGPSRPEQYTAGGHVDAEIIDALSRWIDR